MRVYSKENFVGYISSKNAYHVFLLSDYIENFSCVLSLISFLKFR